MSSPNRSTSNIEDAFSSMNILNYTSVSSDYFHYLLRKAVLLNLRKKLIDICIPPVFSSFYNNPCLKTNASQKGVNIRNTSITLDASEQLIADLLQPCSTDCCHPARMARKGNLYGNGNVDIIDSLPFVGSVLAAQQDRAQFSVRFCHKV
ncbi:hypothetical protein Tco_1081234 [Tanacetum coccineum]|uniref:Uncharacterized protein n=1 Tax=Tanacetum coccineum TaxID=301880 RepID=A0ABQ5HXW9_9ASTR